MSLSYVDVMIAGGGVVGLALAQRLAQLGLSVGVVERGAWPRAVDAKDWLRVSALNRASTALLTDLGVWTALPAGTFAPLRGMQVRDALGGGRLQFDGAEQPAGLLGHMVHNNALRWALLQAVNSHPQVTLWSQTTIESWDQEKAKVKVQLSSGQGIQAQLLVAADGAQSAVRTQADIGVTQWSYAQQGLVATIATEQPHQQVARQIFLDGGPLALLPLADPQRCSIVWSLPTALADALLAESETDFNAQLQQAFGPVLGALRLQGERRAFPLQMRQCTTPVAPRLALVGDAAHTVHPLAGWGLNMGLKDIAVLSDIVVRAYVRGRDLGHAATLARYRRYCVLEHWQKQLTLTGLHRLYQFKTPAWCLARKFGMQTIEQQRLFKRWLVAAAG